MEETLVLFALDEQAGVGSVDRDQVAVVVAGGSEVLACAPQIVAGLVTHDGVERACESGCDGADDAAIAVANVLFLERH